jgi:hypothetical protein
MASILYVLGRFMNLLNHRALAKPIGSVILAGPAIAALMGIASAYLQPALRKAIVFSGFGLC